MIVTIAFTTANGVQVTAPQSDEESALRRRRAHYGREGESIRSGRCNSARTAESRQPWKQKKDEGKKARLPELETLATKQQWAGKLESSFALDRARGPWGLWLECCCLDS